MECGGNIPNYLPTEEDREDEDGKMGHEGFWGG